MAVPAGLAQLDAVGRTRVVHATARIGHLGASHISSPSHDRQSARRRRRHPDRRPISLHSQSDVSLALAALCRRLTAISIGMGLGLLPAVFLALHFAVVLPEEEYLEAKFGEIYVRYKQHVRRWV
jgi:hypothetical protein